MRVMIVVTHLLGTGHLTRALTLGRAFQHNGHDTTLVSGGFPVARLDTSTITFEQLPPVRSDGANFTRLLDGEGNPVSDAYMADRAAKLRSILLRTTPDLLITELFPFGRRNLKAEFQELLTAATSRTQPPLIACSVRDILAPPSKPKKVNFAEDIITQYYDVLLCHARADITPLSLSWPISDRIEEKLRYTGFVAPPLPAPHPDRIGAGEILVSAGGGDVGQHVFETALSAAKGEPRPWRLLIGGEDPQARIDALRRQAPAHVIIEPARPDFRQMLPHAAASVSLCGYNTALDVLQSGVPAVFVPFDDGSEVEQGIRAGALAESDGIEMVETARLSAASLRDALDRAMAAPKREAMTTGVDGAQGTVDIVTELQAVRHAH